MSGKSNGDNGYYGGKGQIFRQLINEIPPHETYIAGFLGHDAVMRNKRLAARNVGIDLDAAPLRRMAKEMCGEEIRGDGVFAVPEELEDMGIGRAMEVSVSFCKDEGADTEARYDFIRACVLTWLAKHEWDGGEFLYLDPTYLWETRSSLTSGYKYELSKEQHEKLLDVILGLPINVMISGYWSELYQETLKDWRSKRMQAVTRAGVVRTEYIWMNYDPPSRLHDYRWLGDDYRERERIKRKVTRWRDKLEGMDLLERQALMSALEDVGL